MPLSASDLFNAAQTADVNRPVAKVQLILGNYASASAYGSSAASLGGDLANYPASGAIDGDRTELNIGPASAADNDIGLSAWRSLDTVASVGYAQLTVTFDKPRIINRVKLYHAGYGPLKTFYLGYWDGSAWQPIGATQDIWNVYSGTKIITTGELDVIDFTEGAASQIKIVVLETEVPNDHANIIELEAYRLLDITERVKGIAIKRNRDYKLANPMAAGLSLSCLNADRFFSISHTPTATETSLFNFVNSELQPEIGVIVSLGFDTRNVAPGGTEPEIVPAFVGTLDRISLNAAARDATIEARDSMKTLINRLDSTKLKSTIDIGTAIQYVLNRCNISNYESNLDEVGINIDYFFTEDQDPLSTIRDLVQAAGDALFYFDEQGIATFKSYAGQTPNDHLYTSQTDFDAGTYTGSMASIPDQLELSGAGGGTGESLPSSGYSPGDLNIPASVHRVTSLAIRITPSSSETITQINVALKVRGVPAGSSTVVRIALCQESGGAPGTQLFHTTISNSSGSEFIIPPISGLTWPVTGGTPYWITFEEDSSTPTNCIFRLTSMPIAIGSWSGGGNAKARFVPHGGGPCTGDPASTTAWQDVEDSSSTGPIGTAAGDYVLVGTIITGTWTSPVLDTGSSTVSYGALTDTHTLNGATILYETRSSPDGTSWGAWQSIAGSGQIQSTVHRYLQIRVTLTIDDSLPTPFINDITVNWTVGAGSQKYPSTASFTFRFDSTMLEVQQELADNLGGDTAILNDITVQAAPLVLSGNNADTVWQATVGTPPVNISGSVPLAVTNGQTITLAPVISGGMDTTRMSGSNPAALAITFAGGATGSWSFISIHPTRPVVQILITHDGNITDLRIIGKLFSSASYLQAQSEKDSFSIGTYGDRQLSLSNSWIVGTSVADTIAKTLLRNFRLPVVYIPACTLRPTWNAQIGDRVTIVDVNLDLSADYIAVGLEHHFSVSGLSGTVGTMMTLIQVPAGF